MIEYVRVSTSFIIHGKAIQEINIWIQSEFCFQITIKNVFLINNHYKTIYESAFLHGVNCQAKTIIHFLYSIFPPFANNKVTV